MHIETIADEAALQSALISGFDPRTYRDEQFDLHCRVLRDVLGCKTGALTHPIIINMTLCDHRERVHYRPGKRAAEAKYLPDSKYVRHLFLCWWLKIQRDIVHVRECSEEARHMWAWEQHDFLICLEPFKSANGRTARVVYYMLLTALKLPVHVISAEKAATYYEHKHNFRRKKFAPLMRAHGYIS